MAWAALRIVAPASATYRGLAEQAADLHGQLRHADRVAGFLHRAEGLTQALPHRLAEVQVELRLDVPQFLQGVARQQIEQGIFGRDAMGGPPHIHQLAGHGIDVTFAQLF